MFNSVKQIQDKENIILRNQQCNNQLNNTKSHSTFCTAIKESDIPFQLQIRLYVLLECEGKVKENLS